MSQAPHLSIDQLGRRRSQAAQRIREWLIKAALVVCAVITVAITAGILFILTKETITFFDRAGHPDDNEQITVVDPADFFFGGQWNPQMGDENGQKHFGIWPLIVGTLKIALIAMCFALPIGLISAIWLSEFAKPRVRAFIKPIIEVLSGIPTVVFGFFAITFITPILLRWEWWQRPVLDANGVQRLDDEGNAVTEAAGFLGFIEFGTFNALGAGLAVGIMCLPIVTSLSEDAIRAVPRALREGAYGLGASKFEASIKVVVPAALSGISAAFLLAIARAVGETMIVTLAAGAKAINLVSDGGGLELGNALAINEDVLPMTGYIVNVYKGDAAHGSIAYYSTYAVAATLFMMTLGITILGNMIQKRFREKYD